ILTRGEGAGNLRVIFLPRVIAGVRLGGRRGNLGLPFPSLDLQQLAEHPAAYICFFRAENPRRINETAADVLGRNGKRCAQYQGLTLRLESL
ncbi:MAG: hypothetical protein ABSD79_03630, partial [Dehalococcoidales bacterium]